jgi:aspartate kinase
MNFANPHIYHTFNAKSDLMKVFKFGGASVKDSTAIRNMAEIVSGEKDNLVIVVSAFGKTTNALEKVLRAWLEGDPELPELVGSIHDYHMSVVTDLSGDDRELAEVVNASFSELRKYLSGIPIGEYDFEYDQVVSFGEIWATLIISGYLKTVVPGIEWIDIRKHLITDERYRDANIIWDKSMARLLKIIDFSRNRIYLTQGFIGGTLAGYTTTLGREGSDYTAAILANILDAESLVVWKDVPGILNADPKWLAKAVKMDEISYKEAVEMTFSGAKVIHPKTIKPLHNKNIPLYVRSFMRPAEEGTVIRADAVLKELMPVFIRKEDQILVSILPRDFSFVMGDNLARIFHAFLVNGVKVNMVEASAVSLDVCLDDERRKVDAFIEAIKPDFQAVYNENVEMLSVRHYTPEALEQITRGREILLEQRTRSTVRFVVRKN